MIHFHNLFQLALSLVGYATLIIQKQFKRIETNYILEKAVLNQVLQDLEPHLEADT